MSNTSYVIFFPASVLKIIHGNLGIKMCHEVQLGEKSSSLFLYISGKNIFHRLLFFYDIKKKNPNLSPKRFCWTVLLTGLKHLIVTEKAPTCQCCHFTFLHFFLALNVLKMGRNIYVKYGKIRKKVVDKIVLIKTRQKKWEQWKNMYWKQEKKNGNKA